MNAFGRLSRSWPALVGTCLLTTVSSWRCRAPRAERTFLPIDPTALPGDGEVEHPALSWDGQELAFVRRSSDAGSGGGIYIRNLATGSTRQVMADEVRLCCLAWAPDARTIAFVRLAGADSALLTVPAAGGAPARRKAITPWFGTALSWSPDGRELAHSDRPAGGGPFAVFIHSMNGLPDRQVTHPSFRAQGDAFARFSPDGKTIVFSRVSASGDALMISDLQAVPAAGGEPRAVTRDNQFIGDVGFLPDGHHVLFSSVRDGPARLWTADLASGEEPARLTSSGEPILGESVAINPSDVGTSFRFSVAPRGGAIVVCPTSYDTEIWRLDTADPGAALQGPPLIASAAPDESPQYSPDGARIAFASARSGKPEVWTCDASGANCDALTRLGVHSGTPRWSPDGLSIAFDSRPEGQSDIFVKDVKTLRVHRITADPAEDVVPSFSRSGRFVYFASNRSQGWQIWKAPAEGGAAVPVTKGGGFAPFESVDGQWILYTHLEAGGLWKTPVAGGPETKVLDQPACWGYWTVTGDGVTLLDTPVGRPPTLAHLSLATGRVTALAPIAKPPACAESGLAASPDGRSLLYVGVEQKSRAMVARDPR